MDAVHSTLSVLEKIMKMQCKMYYSYFFDNIGSKFYENNFVSHFHGR